MSRPPKPAATAKKVAPPAVPHEFRHSGSSFGSAGYASSEDTGGFLAAPEPGVPRGKLTVSPLLQFHFKKVTIDLDVHMKEFGLFIPQILCRKATR